MGALSGRQAAAVGGAEAPCPRPYRYPPASGEYFGAHFIMGGERFDAPQPEAYLFGENADLNFLGGKPTPFPYPPPQADEPTKTLASLVNVRKESLRLVRVGDSHHLEFTFDCDAPVDVQIHYRCEEEATPDGVRHRPRDPRESSPVYRFGRGADRRFSRPDCPFRPLDWPEEHLSFDPDADVDTFPVAIRCTADADGETRQTHVTYAAVERHADGSLSPKPLKQKLFVDGLCYLLQEIYGIENKNPEREPADPDDAPDDDGGECVICMCDARDTLILPCRHLCLCNSCADSLRYQANNCPICRAPFRALLQIRALRRREGRRRRPPEPDDDAPPPPHDSAPAGYETVSLIEALNGPRPPRQAPRPLRPAPLADDAAPPDPAPAPAPVSASADDDDDSDAERLSPLLSRESPAPPDVPPPDAGGRVSPSPLDHPLSSPNESAAAGPAPAPDSNKLT